MTNVQSTTAAPRAGVRQRPRRPLPVLIGDAGLTIGVALIVLPLVFTVLTSLRTSADVSDAPLGFPKSFTLDSFRAAYQSIHYGTSVVNSLVVLSLSAVITVIAGALAAYPLARLTRSWAGWVYRLFIAGSTVPVFVLIAPLYLLMRDLGLLDSYLGVVLIYAALNLPVAVFFYTSFFRQIPLELEEAAAIDGAGPLRTFFTILFPLLRPITATLATFLTLSIWNDLIIPLVFIQTAGRRTVMANAYSLVGTYSVDPTVLFPAALLGVAPLLVVFILLQREVVEGLTMGAVKS